MVATVVLRNCLPYGEFSGFSFIFQYRDTERDIRILQVSQVVDVSYRSEEEGV